MNENAKYIIATIAMLIFGVSFALYSYFDEISSLIFPSTPKEVHVHADFLLFVSDKKLDLTNEKYQSTPESVKHPSMHFHDGVDTMLHRHAEGITLGDFFASLGFTLTDTCLTTDQSETYCTDPNNTLILFVNGIIIPDIANYIVQEEDRILLYYGDPNASNLTELQQTVTDEACMYSGKCPERGEPPFESCGLTCEI